MSTLRAVRRTMRFLESLPNIADHLSAQGIRGWRQNRFSCPIANYLKVKHGDAPSVGTHAFTILVEPGAVGRLFGRQPRRVIQPLSPNVRLFIRRFDLGGFPNLQQKD